MLFAIVNVFILAGLVKFLIESEQPLLCAGVYATIHFLVGLAFGAPFWVMVMLSVIILAIGALYFWLLDKLEGSGPIWWLVFILGLPVMVAV
jgi:hypothetical protein